jgi:hypothetical protein
MKLKKIIKNSILNNEIKKNKLDHARWSKWPSVPMIKKKKKKPNMWPMRLGHIYLFFFYKRYMTLIIIIFLRKIICDESSCCLT